MLSRSTESHSACEACLIFRQCKKKSTSACVQSSTFCFILLFACSTARLCTTSAVRNYNCARAVQMVKQEPPAPNAGACCQLFAAHAYYRDCALLICDTLLFSCAFFLCTALQEQIELPFYHSLLAAPTWKGCCSFSVQADPLCGLIQKGSNTRRVKQGCLAFLVCSSSVSLTLVSW